MGTSLFVVSKGLKLKLLDAVNLVLPKLGERPVTALDVKHPTLAIILPVVDQTIQNTLQRGWWFNEYVYTAYPDPAGEIALGTAAMSFVPSGVQPYFMRGERLFNPETRSYVFSAAVEGTLIERLEFDDLPESAATYVFYASLVEAYTTDLGVSQELQIWQSLAGRAYSDLMMEHLRHRKFSTRKSRRWRQLIHAMRS